MFLNEINLISPEDIPDLSAAGGGAAAGAAAAKRLGINKLTGALGGLGAGLSAKNAYDRYRNKDYLGAAIAAAGGVAGLVPNPAVGIGGPMLAGAINACRDDPEACRELGSEIKQAITSPFSSPSKGRGAGRNVLPSTPRQQIPQSNKQSTKTIAKPEDDLDTIGDDDPRSLEEDRRDSFQASPGLIQSIKDIESGNNPAAISPKGAMGTMQVMPGTARDPGFGVQPAKDFSATELERVGQDYFNAMLNKYGGDKRLALIAYNMGPAAADQWLAKGANPSRLPKETQGYVPKVLDRYQKTSYPAPRQQTDMVKKPVVTTAPRPKVSAVQVNPQSISQDELRVPYAYTAPPGQSASNFRNLNPNWTPPPGPRIAPKPNPQDLERIIRQKNRPQSIEDIINRAKRKEVSKDELSTFINKLSANKQIDPEVLSYIKDLQSDNVVEEVANINEDEQKLIDKLYDTLEIKYGDLVRLYGHEVVGDAIQEIVLNSDDQEDPDLDKLAKSVLQLLRKELEEELQVSETSNTNDTESNLAAVNQIQTDINKIKNTLDIKESKIYFNVVATSSDDLKFKFGLSKDRKGWYLNENANPNQKLDVMRVFSIIK